MQAAASAHRCDHALAFCTPSARVQLRRVERRRLDRRPLGAPRMEGDGRQLFPWRRLNRMLLGRPLSVAEGRAIARSTVTLSPPVMLM